MRKGLRAIETGVVGILDWLEGGALRLLTLAGIILLIWGTVAPVSTLVWWVGEGAERLGLRKTQPKQLPATFQTTAPPGETINCYVVFLTGVGDFSSNELTPEEEFFLDRLEQSHPNCVTVRNVFPYSVANVSLDDQRFLSPVWHTILKLNERFPVTDVFVKIRNLWRLAISADYRYGRVYNQGIADAIVNQMNQAHPIATPVTSPLKVILIGTSGGAQVALGAAPYVDQWLNADLTVVSIGGVFSGKEGFIAADQVYHLEGDRDPIEDLGWIVFPSRWAWTVGSPFNQAKQAGRYTTIPTGSHAHDGSQGYFGNESPDGKTTYVEITLQQVNNLPIW